TLVFDFASQTPKILFRNQQNLTHIAISADGRWVATGPYGGGPVDVWDARTGKHVRYLGSTYVGLMAFSPDSKWLVTGLGQGLRDLCRYQFWEVGTWQLAREISSGSTGVWPVMAFTHDNKMLAIVPSRGQVRLLDPATDRELATLEAPDPQMISWL